jgi:hypothetical protein
MNNERSRKKASEYLAEGNPLIRRELKLERKFNHPVEKVFHQLCPTREYDWIDGWECDLLFTSTGFVEKDCIFSTSEANSVGPGLWIFTAYEINERVEIVRIIEDMVVLHLRISLEDNNCCSCIGKWDLTFTAIKEEGNKLVEAVDFAKEKFVRAIDGLEHFLDKGELLVG